MNLLDLPSQLYRIQWDPQRRGQDEDADARYEKNR